METPSWPTPFPPSTSTSSSPPNAANPLSLAIRERLFPYMGGIMREIGASSLLVNGTHDHIHMLANFSTSLTIADAVRDLKSNSSSWVKETFSSDFAWQTGYAAFSVSKSGVDTVLHYITTQEQHHRGMTFQEEYLAFLRKYDVPYDERFVFD